MIIAIDGPAAAGKGTLARRLAKHLNFAYLDSGSLYRAVALSLIVSGNGQPLEDGQPLEEEMIAASQNISAALLSDPRLRDEATGHLASKVAANQTVRTNLLHFQQNFAQTPPNGQAGAVIDGRDIGTVVCPDANLKLFVTATPQVRAKRRLLELEEKNIPAQYENILSDIKARDKQDSERATSPLVQAEDAILLDTTELSAENAFNTALGLIKATNLV